VRCGSVLARGRAAAALGSQGRTPQTTITEDP
jgi:hypothetical protein